MATRKDKASEFETKFDEAFSINGQPRDQVLDSLSEAWRSPVLAIAVTLVPGRGPVIASNVANNDPDQIEQMAQVLDDMANQFRSMATEQLRKQLEELKATPEEA